MGRNVLKIELQEPIRGVRLMRNVAAGDAPAIATARWLVQLGEARARREAESKSLQSVVQGMQRTLQQVNTTVVQRLDAIAETVVELGLAVAREIVGEAIDKGLLDPTPTVVHCLRDCVHGSSGGDLVVHLHPDDLAPVLTRLSQMPELRAQLAACRMVPDPALARGAVRAETATGRLRYDPAEVFDRVAATVRSAAAQSFGGPKP